MKKPIESSKELSHEIRVPLNVIIGMNEMILRESKNPTIRGYARSIEWSSMHLLSLIESVFGDSLSENTAYDTEDLILMLRSLFLKSAGEKGLKLKIDRDPSVPRKLSGDITKIRQICINLLSNAIKYTDNGRVEFCISSKNQNGVVDLIINVKDTGIGFNKDLLSAVETDDNHGLGLSITKDLVEEMGGTISVESIAGEGSTFIVQIQQDIAQNNEEDYPTSFTAPDAKVLIVDDTKINLTVIEGLLKKTQIKVDIAETGRDCLKKVLFKGFDVIFLDVCMSEVNGVDLLKELRGRNLIPEVTKVIAMTGNASDSYRKEYLKEGFDDYIAKPILPNVLEEVLIRNLPERKVIYQKIEPITDKELPEWLYGNGYIDTSEGLRMCGTVPIYLKALVDFRRQAPGHIKSIHTSFNSQDKETLEREIHSVKSMAAVIGCTELVDLAKTFNNSWGILNQLVTLYEAVTDSLSMLDEDIAPTKESVDEDAVPMLLKHLKEYADDFNDEAVGSMLKAISKYQIPDEYKAVFEELKTAHEEADWVTMKEILKDYE